ncbi:MAG: CobD/CbiB family protein [Nevskia sp.]
MILVAMLLALAGERLLSPYRDGVIAARFGSGLLRALPAGLRQQAALPWLLTGLAAGLVALLCDRIGSVVVQVPVAALVLFLCLGPRDLAEDVQRLRAARSAGDAATVARLTRLLQMGPEPDADHRSLLGALFIQSHERRFGVLLWFVVAGPAGAVLYRVASRLPSWIDAPDGAQVRAAAWLHGALAWLPVRATALLYGLAGSLDDAIAAWRRVHAEPHPDWQRHSWSLLAETANAALDWEDSKDGGPMVTSSLDPTLAEVLRMETRATLIVLALTALFTAGVWVS